MWRCLFDKERHCVVYYWKADQVIVVQKQDDLVVDFDKLVDQRGNDGVWRDERGVGSQADRRSAYIAAGMPQRMRQIIEEARGFVVLRVERQPRHLCTVRAQPVEPNDRQRSFAESGGRFDHGETFARGALSQTDEPRTTDQIHRQVRRNDLRCKEKVRPARGRFSNHTHFSVPIVIGGGRACRHSPSIEAHPPYWGMGGISPVRGMVGRAAPGDHACTGLRSKRAPGQGAAGLSLTAGRLTGASP